MSSRFLIILLAFSYVIKAQNTIPLDTLNWKINAKSFMFENYKGKDAIYLQAGAITLKDKTFLNGIIEFDVFLKEEQAFPGVYFRGTKDLDSEQWFMRPHLSGKPDANQAAPATKGITPWQLYFGKKYSFPYSYKFNDWTHVKLVVKDNKAQVFLDHAKQPNLSWNLFHKKQEGIIALRGGRLGGIHLADIKISYDSPSLVNFKPKKRETIDNLINTWKISDKFDEKKLNNYNAIKAIINSRKWQHKIQIEEGTAANISRKVQRYGKGTGNTVFTKIEINSKVDQIKLFEFGYSDRVVVILNNKPIYRGNNKWRSRDYRYLGTVGLFDAVYLPLKKGKNTLLMAVSEDFGGWLITGRFEDYDNISINKH